MADFLIDIQYCCLYVFSVLEGLACWWLGLAMHCCQYVRFCNCTSVSRWLSISAGGREYGCRTLVPLVQVICCLCVGLTVNKKSDWLIIFEEKVLMFGNMRDDTFTYRLLLL